jgi:hypothetical protein
MRNRVASGSQPERDRHERTSQGPPEPARCRGPPVVAQEGHNTFQSEALVDRTAWGKGGQASPRIHEGSTDCRHSI